MPTHTAWRPPFDLSQNRRTRVLPEQLLGHNSVALTVSVLVGGAKSSLENFSHRQSGPLEQPQAPNLYSSSVKSHGIISAGPTENRRAELNLLVEPRETELFLGTAQFARNYGVLASNKAVANDTGEALLRFAVANGWQGFDTAPSYGSAEIQLGKLRTDLQVHTKLSPSLDVSQSLRNSISHLRREILDVVYFHEEFTLSNSHRARIADLSKYRGLSVRSIGASIYSLQEFERAIQTPEVDVIQVPLNPFDQRFNQSIIGEAQRLGKRIFVRSIFLQGVLLANPGRLPSSVSHLKPELEIFHAELQKLGISRLEACLEFAREFVHADGLIVGSMNIAQIQEVKRALDEEPTHQVTELVESIRKPDWAMVDPRKWR